MRFPTMWYVRQAMAQISLRIRAVWPEPLLVAWIFYYSYATNWTSFGVSKLKRRLHRLVWVYTCENTTLLEITWRGSLIKYTGYINVLLIQRWMRIAVNKKNDQIQVMGTLYRYISFSAIYTEGLWKRITQIKSFISQTLKMSAR